MSVTWANWFDFDRGTSRSSNAIASRKMVTNDKAEVKVEEKNITNKNVFGEAASLELSDGFVAEKKSYSPAMLMESKAAARTLKVGCKGDDVKRLQENLNTLGFNTGKPDGIFGDGTKKAVIAFQKSKGLTADGIVGAGTQNAITRAINEKNAANNGVLKVGSRGSRVTNLQNSLNALGYNAGKADGIFGTGTQNEVIRFQKTYGLTADGQVGSNTESAINKALNYKKNNILSKGQVSNDVKNLQNDLKTLGYLTGNADGAFGAGTESAVKAFQQKHGLTADGLAGSSTRAKIADAIAEKNKPKPESNVLKLGSKGENVRTLQNNLNALGYNAGTADGQFGNNTQTAVTKFQKTYGLTADGQAGPNTLNAINQTIKYKNQKILSKGQISEDVRTLQSNLKKLGYLSGSADGVFGAGTESAVKAFQKANGLTQDGLAGETTRNKISAKVKNNTPTTPSNPSNPTTPVKPGNNNVPMIYDYIDYGALSAKHEASGSCGQISTGSGDSGGKSYGLYQFASKYDVPLSFVNWLEDKNKSFYTTLKNAYDLDGGYKDNFDNAWKELANNNEKSFSEYQYLYVKEHYYDDSVNKIKSNQGFDVTKRGYTLNAVIWSRAVQHGGCSTIFQRATANMDLSKASDEEIIKALYKESGKVVNTPPHNDSIEITTKDREKYNIPGKYLYYFSRNSSNTQAGVYNRLHNTEINDALEMLKNYG